MKVCRGNPLPVLAGKGNGRSPDDAGLIGVEGQVEMGIGVIRRRQQGADLDFDTQFFPNDAS